MEVLKERIPFAMFKDFDAMSLNEKGLFILRGFNCYVREYGDVYNTFLKFVNEIRHCHNQSYARVKKLPFIL